MCVVPLCVVYDVCMCGWVVQGCGSFLGVCMCMSVCILSCVFACVCVPMNTVLQMISRECV